MGIETLKIDNTMQSTTPPSINAGNRFTMKALLLFAACAVGLSTLAARGQTNWPIELAAPEGKIVVYQPQPTSFKDDTISAEAAVSTTLKGTNAPVFGVAWFQARIDTDRSTRTATIANVKVTKMRFPDTAAVDEKKFSDFVGAKLTAMALPISLDRLRESLEGVWLQGQGAGALQNEPPKIIFATTPTVLVTLDGAPELQPLEGSKVMKVVNTPFAIVFDPATKTYFLRTGDNWMGAPDIAGPWQQVKNLPDPVRAAIPAEMATNKGGAGEGAVVIVTATEATELVVTDGEPKYTPLPGNELLYMSNTESDVFLDIDSASYFILLSGRWYNAPALDGPWKFVNSKGLPSSFARISADGPKGSVLAHVAGTLQAEDAVIEASIPQTQEIRRDAPVDLKVSYDGDPTFEKMEGTTAEYAKNTADSVVKADGNYYCCKDAVWYQSPQPSGPWVISVAVPPPVYQIPPSSPVYNVTYVRVYDSTPTTVFVGYTLGYTGCYARGGIVVYGTGYRYAAWRGVVYYARPVTWGFGVRYNPYSNSWGFGVRVGRFGAWYGPALGWGGSISPYSGWWGPGGYRNYGEISGNKIEVNRNTYNSWGGNSYNTTNNNNNSKNVGNINIGNGNNSGNRNGNRIGNGNGSNLGNGDGNRIGNGNGSLRPGNGGDNAVRPGRGDRIPSGGNGSERPVRPGSGERPTQLPAGGTSGGYGDRLAGRGESRPTQLPAGAGDNIYKRPDNSPILAPSREPKPSQPIARPASGAANNIFGDQAGNVFRKNDDGWQERGKNGWKPASQPGNNNLPGKPNQPAARQPAVRQPSDFERARPQLERDNQARNRGKAESKREAQPKQQPAKQQPSKQPAPRPNPVAKPQAQPKQQPANPRANAAAGKRKS